MNKSQPSIHIEIDNQKIIYTTKTKFLGVVIDHKFNGKDHISYISGKIARCLGIIIKARQCFTKAAMLSFNYCFFFHILYVAIIFGVCLYHLCETFSDLTEEDYQNKPKIHTYQLLKQMSLLKCEHIHNYLIGKFMYKAYDGELIMFQSLFKKNSDFHSYHTRQMNHHIPSAWT